MFLSFTSWYWRKTDLRLKIWYFQRKILWEKNIGITVLIFIAMTTTAVTCTMTVTSLNITPLDIRTDMKCFVIVAQITSKPTLLLQRTYEVWCEGNVFSASVLLFTGGGVGRYLAKKCSCPERRGIQPKSAQARGGGGGLEVPIMHCCLHVISPLTCCKKEELEACTCLYS